jgi:hypothetical protein
MPLKKPAPGDDLLRLAHKDGVSAEAVRARPENRELLSYRDAGVLSADDELFIPDPEPAKFRVRTGETHCFVYKPARRILHLLLTDEHGAARQSDYTLSDFQYDGPKPAYGAPFPDQLHGFAYQGVVHETLPAALAQLTLTLADAPEDPLEIHLGRLDPVSTTRGLKTRLQGLGMYQGDVEDTSYDADLHAAVKDFQRAQGLAASGAADAPTRARLRSVYGG